MAWSRRTSPGQDIGQAASLNNRIGMPSSAPRCCGVGSSASSLQYPACLVCSSDERTAGLPRDKWTPIVSKEQPSHPMAISLPPACSTSKSFSGMWMMYNAPPCKSKTLFTLSQRCCSSAETEPKKTNLANVHPSKFVSTLLAVGLNHPLPASVHQPSPVLMSLGSASPVRHDFSMDMII